MRKGLQKIRIFSNIFERFASFFEYFQIFSNIFKRFQTFLSCPSCLIVTNQPPHPRFSPKNQYHPPNFNKKITIFPQFRIIPILNPPGDYFRICFANLGGRPRVSVKCPIRSFSICSRVFSFASASNFRSAKQFAAEAVTLILSAKLPSQSRQTRPLAELLK